MSEVIAILTWKSITVVIASVQKKQWVALAYDYYDRKWTGSLELLFLLYSLV